MLCRRLDYIHSITIRLTSFPLSSLPHTYPIHVYVFPTSVRSMTQQCAGGGQLFGSVLLPRGGNEQWQRHGAVCHQDCAQDQVQQQQEEEDWRRRYREGGKRVGMLQRMYAIYLFSTCASIHKWTDTMYIDAMVSFLVPSR